MLNRQKTTDGDLTEHNLIQGRKLTQYLHEQILGCVKCTAKLEFQTHAHTATAIIHTIC